MPDFRRAHCQICGRHKSVCGPISWAGRCQECGIRIVTENIVGLATMTGYPRERWRRGIAASVGAVLMDELEPPG